MPNALISFSPSSSPSSTPPPSILRLLVYSSIGGCILQANIDPYRQNIQPLPLRVDKIGFMIVSIRSQMATKSSSFHRLSLFGCDILSYQDVSVASSPLVCFVIQTSTRPKESNDRLSSSPSSAVKYLHLQLTRILQHLMYHGASILADCHRRHQAELQHMLENEGIRAQLEHADGMPTAPDGTTSLLNNTATLTQFEPIERTLVDMLRRSCQGWSGEQLFDGFIHPRGPTETIGACFIIKPIESFASLLSPSSSASFDILLSSIHPSLIASGVHVGPSNQSLWRVILAHTLQLSKLNDTRSPVSIFMPLATPPMRIHLRAIHLPSLSSSALSSSSSHAPSTVSLDSFSSSSSPSIHPLFIVAFEFAPLLPPQRGLFEGDRWAVIGNGSKTGDVTSFTQTLLSKSLEPNQIDPLYQQVLDEARHYPNAWHLSRSEHAKWRGVTILRHQSPSRRQEEFQEIDPDESDATLATNATDVSVWQRLGQIEERVIDMMYISAPISVTGERTQPNVETATSSDQSDAIPPNHTAEQSHAVATQTEASSPTINNTTNSDVISREETSIAETPAHQKSTLLAYESSSDATQSSLSAPIVPLASSDTLNPVPVSLPAGSAPVPPPVTRPIPPPMPRTLNSSQSATQLDGGVGSFRRRRRYATATHAKGNNGEHTNIVDGLRLKPHPPPLPPPTVSASSIIKNETTIDSPSLPLTAPDTLGPVVRPLSHSIASLPIDSPSTTAPSAPHPSSGPLLLTLDTPRLTTELVTGMSGDVTARVHPIESTSAGTGASDSFLPPVDRRRSANSMMSVQEKLQQANSNLLNALDEANSNF